MATTKRFDTSQSKAPVDIIDRQPPRNLEAERAVIGSILLLPEACDDVAMIVRPEDFYDDANQRLYTHIRAMHDGGKRIDLTLLHDRLKSAGELDLIGGRAYLAELYQSVPTAAHAVYYAQIVRDKATLRSLIHSSTGDPSRRVRRRDRSARNARPGRAKNLRHSRYARHGRTPKFATFSRTPWHERWHDGRANHRWSRDRLQGLRRAHRRFARVRIDHPGGPALDGQNGAA